MACRNRVPANGGFVVWSSPRSATVSWPVLIPISDSCMGILSRPVEFLFELPEDDSSLRWARGLDHIVFADNNIAQCSRADWRCEDPSDSGSAEGERAGPSTAAVTRADSTPSSDWGEWHAPTLGRG